MLIERYDLEVTTPPCDPGVERFHAIARLTADISQVLPYLNTIWKGAIYAHRCLLMSTESSGSNFWP